MINRTALILMALLLAVSVTAGYLFYRNGVLSQHNAQLEQSLADQVAEVEALRSENRRVDQILARLDTVKDSIHRSLRKTSDQLRKDLKDDACANSPLPKSVVDGLRQPGHQDGNH